MSSVERCVSQVKRHLRVLYSHHRTRHAHVRVVQTRTYGTPEFYAEMGFREDEAPQDTLARGRALLRGEDDVEI